jgi:phosphoribosylformylglycinamidine synthase
LCQANGRNLPCQRKEGVKLAAARRFGHRPATSRPLAKRVQTMKARVLVTLKSGVLDPQGRAIHHALEGLGFDGVNDVRAGKLIELDLADNVEDAAIEEMCRKLLANTVIENFRIERVG